MASLIWKFRFKEPLGLRQASLIGTFRLKQIQRAPREVSLIWKFEFREPLTVYLEAQV